MYSIINNILFRIGSICKYSYRIWCWYGIIRDRIYSGYLSSKVKSDGRLSANWPVFISGTTIKFNGTAHIRKFTRISCITNYGRETFQPEIIIGDNSNIGMNNHIGCIDKIKIGKNFLSGANCLITDHSHGENKTYDELLIAPNKRHLYSKGPVIIGDNVHLGENVIILPGTTIGDNVIIGAGSVVTKDVQSNVIVAGNPATVKRIIRE